MKRLLNILASVASLLILGLLASRLVLMRDQSSTLAAPGTFQSPVEKPLPITPAFTVLLELTPAPPFPGESRPFQSPLIEPTPIGVLPSTPFPDRGIYVSASTTLTPLADESTIDRLSFPDWDGTELVARAEAKGKVAVVLVDLTNGQMHLLNQLSERGAVSPHISGRYVVWADPVPEGDLLQMRVYDLRTDRLFSPYVPGYYHQLDFADGIAVWQDYRDNKWGIYGYNVRTSQAITIGQGNLGCPQISYPWVIYLDTNLSSEGSPANIARLWAYHLRTAERLSLGLVFNPNDATACSYHAIDDSRVAWLGLREEQNTKSETNPETGQTEAVITANPAYEPHVYDLRTRTDRILDIPIQWPPRTLLSGDVVVFGNVGFDLASDIPFNVIPDPQWANEAGLPLLLSDDRVVWLTNLVEGSPQIHIAPIIRQTGAR